MVFLATKLWWDSARVIAFVLGTGKDERVFKSMTESFGMSTCAGDIVGYYDCSLSNKGEDLHRIV